MRNRSKRLLSWLLLVAMLCTLLPTSVFATEELATDVAVQEIAGEILTTESAEDPGAEPAQEELSEEAVTEEAAPEEDPSEEAVPEEAPAEEPSDGLVPVEMTKLPEAAAADLLMAEGTTYVLAGSDFQPTDASNTTGVNLLNAILDKVDDKYTTMDGFIFAGDYDYNYEASTDGKNALQGAVQEVYGTSMDEVYVQGNHDTDDLVGSVLSASGAHDADAYGVYVINEKDYMWYNNDETTIKNTAASLEAYLNAKRNAEYTKPIFVVSHLPLHYCMRTQVGGGDGKHANYIFDVLNEAGAAGLNIIFLFGHNHSHGWDDPYGGAAIFLTKGDSINIAQNSTTVYDVETLNFTYMNAGYVSYYRHVNQNAETDLSMTTFEITETEVTISRFTADGLHDLKSAGVKNQHAVDGSSVDSSCSSNHGGGTETYAPDTSTVASAYTLTLNTEITPAGTEVEVPDSGTTTTERTYTRVTSLDQMVSGGQYLIIENGGTDYFMLPESISNDAGDRIGYNIESTSVAGGDTITGDYEAKEWTMTGSGTNWVLSTDTGSAYFEYQSSTRAYGRISSTNSSTFTIGGSADAYTFSTTTNGYTYVFDHSSAGLINGYVKDASTLFYIYRLTDEGSSTPTVDTSGGDWVTITEPVEAGTRYVYELDTDGIDTDVEYLIVANGYEKALSAAASSNNAVDIEIEGNYAYADSDTYGWTFTKSYNTGYYIRLNGDGTYLNQNRGTLGSQDYATWSVSSNDDGSYDITSGWSTTYNLRWSNSNGVFQASSSNEGPVRLYRYVKTETTSAQAGLYGKISGELTYNVEIGTTAADALAKVKAGIGILYHTGDESAAQTYPDDGAGMIWTLDPSYDGVTPGEYAVTIAYNGVILGVAKVVVPSVAIDSYTIDPMSSTVRQGSAQSVQTGSKITVTLEGGDYYTVPVTLSMLSKDGEAISTAEPGTQTGLTVTYNGVVITNDYTLTVTEKVVNNYPEYPDEGAVKVNKTATGIEFQSTGVAQVELSASGVPAQKGADVVVVIDTSSSMKDNEVGDTGKTRIEVLSESLEQMLKQFQTPNDNGVQPDIDIAIIDFNGYYPSSAGDFDRISLSNSCRENEDYAKVFTGTSAGAYIKNVKLSASDFVEVETINATTIASNFSDGTCKSGTNYDGALENAYNLLNAKQTANGDEARDSYVIFLSDGAPFRYNGYNNGSTKNTYDGWNSYLSGDYADANALVSAFPNSSYLQYSYFYNGNGTNHPHLYAEAIKGTPGNTYTVISRDAASNSPAYQMSVNGLGATIYSIGFGLADDGSASEGGTVTVATQQELIQVISSGDGYSYPNVQSAEELTTAFTQIATAINYAASNARFVDQMGDDFDLKITPITDLTGNAITDANGEEVTPKIEIIQYDIYTRQDYLNGTITEDKIGNRKGTYTILETVTFNEAGTEAYSDKRTGNILSGGVIDANYFWYNNNPTAVTIDTNGDGTGDYELPSETFYWKMGTITTYELAMRYYVYLDGSMEGTRPAGSYPTNEYAILHYDNYLGNECEKETVSPVIAWKSANVSYAFYLVNEKGEVIVNQSTGETGTFANKIAITNPVVYQEILLNNTDQIEALQVAALGDNVLPTYYTVYDKEAVYTISIYSDATGEWKINQGSGKVASTYVTQYDPSNASAYTNVTETKDAYDYTHTVVWFAVVWKVQAHPDAVVIDYGLPVDISVLTNDMFGEYGKLAGIGAYSDSLNVDGYDTAMASGFGDTYEGTYGDATADTTTGKVRYTPSTMEMNTYEKFAYAVNYTGTTNPGYYYDTVTVIPATTIYYEDNFLTYTATNTEWKDAGTAITGATQDEDRPGAYSLTDANNIYGYDSVNKSMSTYSMGTAKKVTVDAESYATATFSFWGTGFDVISMTSGDTGVLRLKVYKIAEDGTVDTTATTSMAVDTYYGAKLGEELHNVTYTYDGTTWVKTVVGPADEGAVETKPDFPKNPAENATVTAIEYVLVADPTATDALYQVPVMQIENLPYGHYKVELRATYYDALNNKKDGAYDLYLDAIRIYDPANDGAADGTTDTTIEDAYKVDGEGWPSYIELRNKIIAANTFGDATTVTKVEGLVFIDGDDEVGDAQMADYVSYGPNNEIYLAPNQSVAFLLNTPSNIDSVHLGVSTVGGATATWTITNIAKENNSETGITAGDYYSPKTSTINTATDMYYDITGYKGDIIVITNTSETYGATGIISLTNIKSTYASNPNSTMTTGDELMTIASEDGGYETSIYMTLDAVNAALLGINNMEKPEPEPTPDPETTPDPEPIPDPKPEIWENPFTDVSASKYFYDAVKYLNQNGIVKGETDTTFGPESKTTRGMLVTMLWRLEGEPAAAKTDYPDVKENKYYTKAVDWASEVGIVQGYEDGTFRPENPVSRQEIVTILYRYAQYKGVEVNASGDLGQFADKGKIYGYAKTPMSWAVDNGVVQGYTDGTVRPTAGASRAEMATLLYRVLTNILGN